MIHEMLPGRLWQGDLIAAIEADRAELLVTCSPETDIVTSFRMRPLHILFPFADAAELPDMELAEQVAGLIAHEVALGRKALVHCTAGKNRSGLMTGLVLRRMGVARGAQLVEYIQRRNPGALRGRTTVGLSLLII